MCLFMDTHQLLLIGSAWLRLNCIHFEFASLKLDDMQSPATQEVGSKLGLLMQDMLLNAFPNTVHLDSGRLGWAYQATGNVGIMSREM